MGAIKEHYHDKIQADYNQMNTTDAAKMARYETLKEVMEFVDKHKYIAEWSKNEVVSFCEQKIKDIK